MKMMMSTELFWGFWLCINTVRLRQDGHHFPYDIFKCIILNENVWISTKISLKLIPRGPNNNILSLVQIMAWRQAIIWTRNPSKYGELVHVAYYRGEHRGIPCVRLKQNGCHIANDTFKTFKCICLTEKIYILKITPWQISNFSICHFAR